MSRERLPEYYLSSPQSFISHRLSYYSKIDTISPKHPKNTDQQSVMEKLRLLRPEIVVVTATKDRLQSLQEAHGALVSQQGGVNWAWLIIDNLSNDNTTQHFDRAGDDRVFVLSCDEETEYAYPVRNMGLDIISSSFWRFQGAEPWVLIIDSDDRLYDQESLRQFIDMTKSSFGKRHNCALVHGYSDTQIHFDNGDVGHFANPRDTSSSFPMVENLAETLYKGLNILAGSFPIESLSWLRYPPEASFEDGGFNEKLLLQAQKKDSIWLAERVPLTIKHFHRESVSGSNNSRGDVTKVDTVGPYFVSGIRADIVRYYRTLIDYFVREQL